MTRPLGQALTSHLEAAETSQAWERMDKDLLRDQVAAIREGYPMADIRIAQFLAEIAVGLQQVINSDDGNLRTTLVGYQTGLLLLAAAVSRERRGRPPV